MRVVTSWLKDLLSIAWLLPLCRGDSDVFVSPPRIGGHACAFACAYGVLKTFGFFYCLACLVFWWTVVFGWHRRFSAGCACCSTFKQSCLIIVVSCLRAVQIIAKPRFIAQEKQDQEWQKQYAHACLYKGPIGVCFTIIHMSVRTYEHGGQYAHACSCKRPICGCFTIIRMSVHTYQIGGQYAHECVCKTTICVCFTAKTTRMDVGVK